MGNALEVYGRVETTYFHETAFLSAPDKSSKFSARKSRNCAFKLFPSLQQIGNWSYQTDEISQLQEYSDTIDKHKIQFNTIEVNIVDVNIIDVNTIDINIIYVNIIEVKTTNVNTIDVNIDVNSIDVNIYVNSIDVNSIDVYIIDVNTSLFSSFIPSFVWRCPFEILRCLPCWISSCIF